MRNTIAMLVLCSLALGLLIAGCGGGSGDASAGSGGEGSSIDKAGFVKQATEICEQTSGKLSAEILAAESGPSTTAADLVQEALTPGLQTELEELRALGTPSEGKGQVQAFLKALQKVIEAAEADPEAFAASVSPYEAAELAGRRYGVSACPISTVEPG